MRLQEEGYIGFVTVTLLKDTKDCLFGVDIKLGNNYTTSITPLLKTLTRRREFTSETVNITSLPTIPTETPPGEAGSPNKYLVIPHLLFTDLDEEVKARRLRRPWRSAG